ncbi:MAG: 7-carboxy-7-deazaguanine synthase QueE [Bacteroidota bacterium]
MIGEEFKLLEQGKLLPLMEEFYSIQGEGANAGKAAYFLRIGGCDVGCYWCDVKESWNPQFHPLTSVEQMISNTAKYPAKQVVITGGEPLIYNLDYLTALLHKESIKIFLETSGSHPFSGEFDWICLSPKKQMRPLSQYYQFAHELKIIIHDDSDFAWAEENAEKVNLECKLYLQPEWSQIENMLPKITNFIMENPKWMASMQIHKYMNIP